MKQTNNFNIYDKHANEIIFDDFKGYWVNSNSDKDYIDMKFIKRIKRIA